MIIVAVDLGQARTGLAVCDRGEVLASPLAVIQERDRARLVERIAAAARERGAQRLVVGLPRNMDGSEGESAQKARETGPCWQKLPGCLWTFAMSGAPPLRPTIT